MRSLCILATLLLIPTASAFPVESGVVILQGTTEFYIVDAATVNLDTLTFSPVDGAPIFDGLLIGYTSSVASDWTFQEISNGRLILNGTPSSTGTMRFNAPWSAYEVSGVIGKPTFESRGDSSWPVGAGTQAITIAKIPSASERATAGAMQALAAMMVIFMAALLIGALIAATRRRSEG